MVLSNSLYQIIKINFLVIKGYDWKYNTRYWTYGMRTTDSSVKWCTNNQPVAPTLWSLGQPNNVNSSENCAQMIIRRQDSTVALDDRHCGVVSALACQVKSNLYRSIFQLNFTINLFKGPPTPKPPCLSPICPTITCKKNVSPFSTKNIKK
jgi:hypothetical protein